jgi:ATP-dependent RNA circularization protein (DNA/RNA ligase family)
MDEFFRFPHTPHIAWLGESEPRGDKVLSRTEANEFLIDDIIIEEKLDGANLGISFNEAGEIQLQNRGSYLTPPYTGQFLKLGQWIEVHVDALFDHLENHHILFGEWCAAKHSLSYESLPDWFMAFDVYDKTQQQFWSTSRRNHLADSIDISHIPSIQQGHLTLNDLKHIVMTHPSHFRQGVMEGIIIRKETTDWITDRAKLVRPDFLQTIDAHWRGRLIEWNQLLPHPANTATTQYQT